MIAYSMWDFESQCVADIFLVIPSDAMSSSRKAMSGLGTSGSKSDAISGSRSSAVAGICAQCAACGGCAGGGCTETNNVVNRYTVFAR